MHTCTTMHDARPAQFRTTQRSHTHARICTRTRTRTGYYKNQQGERQTLHAPTPDTQPIKYNPPPPVSELQGVCACVCLWRVCAFPGDKQAVACLFIYLLN